MFAVNYYKGIAELALACAMAADPRALAVNAYHRKMPETEDGETRLAIHRRNEIYKILVAAFEYLHGVAEMDENVVPGAKLSATAAALERDTMARVVMEGADELCKCACSSSSSPINSKRFSSARATRPSKSSFAGEFVHCIAEEVECVAERSRTAEMRAATTSCGATTREPKSSPKPRDCSTNSPPSRPNRRTFTRRWRICPRASCASIRRPKLRPTPS